MATIRGTASNDRIYGTWQRDVLYGYGGNDLLDGAGGADRMAGGKGNDFYVVDSARDVIVEGANGGRADWVKAIASFKLPDHVENLRLLGEANLAGKGNDLSNKIFGNAGNNNLKGFEGSDKLVGRDGDDALRGGNGNDKLQGGDGRDLLIGGKGNDLLVGGAGGDTLKGGRGADMFSFTSFVDSTSGRARDTIGDFSQDQGDRINLRKIDANISNIFGDDSFRFIGTTEFEDTSSLSPFEGELRYQKWGRKTLIEGDITSDDKADFSILVKGVIEFEASDFIL